MNKEKSLKVSFLDGIFASIMSGMTGNFVTPFFLLLGANPVHVGLLGSLPALFNSIVSLVAAEINKLVKSRVRIICTCVLIQGFAISALALSPFVPEKYRILYFLSMFIFNNVVGGLIGPAWLSLMSDTVDMDKYGSYFAWRNRICGIIILAVSFVSGYFLSFMHNKMLAFILLFSIGGFMRVISGVFQGLMEDIPLAPLEKKHDFNYLQFVGRFKESNFAKFTFFISFISFAAGLAGPFFAVYMLQELKLEYSVYNIVILTGSITSLLSLPYWGRIADKYGNMRVIKIVAKISPFLSILWIFSTKPVWIIFISAVGGYIGSGWGLAINNFIFDACTPQTRTRCFAYFGLTNGIFAFVGAFLGGLIVKYWTLNLFGSMLITIIAVSGIARLLINAFMIDIIKEVKEVPHIEDRDMICGIFGITTLMHVSQGVYCKIVKKGDRE